LPNVNLLHCITAHRFCFLPKAATPCAACVRMKDHLILTEAIREFGPFPPPLHPPLFSRSPERASEARLESILRYPEGFDGRDTS